MTNNQKAMVFLAASYVFIDRLEGADFWQRVVYLSACAMCAWWTLRSLFDLLRDILR
jgi:hypothetical protein